MAIYQPGIPNGGFTPPAPPPVGSAAAPVGPGGFPQSPGASYGTYSNYAPVGSAAWAQAYGMNPASTSQWFNNSTASAPWSATQLAQANAINPGLAAFLMRQPGENSSAPWDQFMQAAGFTQAPGSQTMLDQAGTNWTFNNDPTYGGAAGGPNGHVDYGFAANGTPFSYDRGQIGGNALRQWEMQGGATPAGVTMYNQFASPAAAMPGQYAASAGTSAAQGSTLPGVNPQTTPGSADPNAPPTTLGQIANGTATVPGGNMNIPAAPGNPYTLNIGNYLNPMMGYAMQQGDQSILNSQASAGLLNSGDTAKQLYGYGLGLGANNFNNAAGIAAGQQQFGAGLDQYDQQFAYNAQNADRNFALQSLLGEGQLGLGGATQQGWNDRYLAQLLSGNLGALGQAQGAGAIGGSNAINNAISQMIGSYLGGNALNSLGGLGGG